MRVVLISLRDRSEAPYVAKQNGHVALFPTQHELVGGLGELFDQRRSEVLAEGATDMGALNLGGVIGVKGYARGQKAQDKCRIGWIEQEVGILKCGPSAQQDERDGEQAIG